MLLYTGVIEGDGRLLAWQVVDCLSCFSWSFFVTSFILIILNRIPGLSLRLDAEGEELGVDISEIGEVTFDGAMEFSEARKRKTSKDPLIKSESGDALKNEDEKPVSVQ